MSTAKEARLAVRLSSEQNWLIRQAASVAGSSVTDFTVTAALARAHDVLADRRVFVVDEPAWSQFLELLEAPVSSADPRLSGLLNAPSVFADPPA